MFSVTKKSAPKKSGSKKSRSKKSAPKKTAPKKTAPKKSAPKKSAPKKSGSKKSRSKKSAPKKSAPKKPGSKKKIMSVRNTRKFSRSRDRFRTDLRKRFFGEPSMKIRRLMAKYSPTGKKSKSKSVGKSFTPYRSSRQAVRNLTDEDVKIINKDVRAWLKFILNINNMIFDFPGASHDIILHLFILEMHTIYLRSDKKNKKEALLEMEKQIDTFKISKYMLNAEKDLIDVEMQFVFPPDLKITYDIKDKVRELKAYSSHFIKEYLTYDYDYNIVRLSNTYFHPVFMARIMGKTNEDARFRIKY